MGGEGAIELKNQKKTRRQSWLRKANADSLLWMQKNSAQLLAKAEKLHTRKETAHEFTPEEARQAGQKGGEAVSRNREHMAQIGREGGRKSRKSEA